MKNLQAKLNFRNQWFKRSVSSIATMGISTLVSFPVLSQAYYPPMVFFQPLAYPQYPQRNQNQDSIEALENNPNFKNLLAEIEIAGLTEQVREGKLTLLAPNDGAFNDLSDEAFDKFSDPEMKKKVLQYHLVPGNVTEEDIAKGKVTTLGGKAIAISQEEKTLKLNDANAIFPSTVATNGVIIEIDKVLLPPDF